MAAHPQVSGAQNDTSDSIKKRGLSDTDFAKKSSNNFLNRPMNQLVIFYILLRRCVLLMGSGQAKLPYGNPDSLASYEKNNKGSTRLFIWDTHS
jgi:hypothetical protein